MVTGLSISIQQNSQSVTDNTSNVTIQCSITWNGGSYNVLGTANAAMVVNGTTYTLSGNDANFNESCASSGSEVFWSKILTIQHASDGKGSVSVSLVYDTKTSGAPFSATESKTLTTIPRASTIGASDANIESVSTISVTRKSTAYTHSIQYAFGSLNGYLKADGSLSDTEVKLTETSIAFALPVKFYAQISEAASGACTLICKTYSGNTQIGEAQTAEFTVTASKSKCAPAVSGTVVDSNEATKALTGDENVFVRYMSDALCTITAEAKNNAILESKSIGGVAVTGNTRTITGIDSASVNFYAKDSRGYETAYPKPLEMIPYIRLTGVLAAARTDPTSGDATLSVKGNCFNGSFGAQENSLAVSYKIGSGDYVAMELAQDGNTYTATAYLTGLDYQSSHKITVEISDKLETVTKTVTIGKGIPVFDWGEEDFAFHVDVDIKKTLNVAGTATVGGDMTVTGSLTVGGKSLLNLIYPVGSIYMSVQSTSPETLFGGTWTQLKDRFLLGVGDSYKVNDTGGESTVTLTVDQLPSHRHSVTGRAGTGTSTTENKIETFSAYTETRTAYTDYTGGGEAHNNMPPYLAVYMWKRTA